MSWVRIPPPLRHQPAIRHVCRRSAINLPRGKITDYGDLIHEERWIIKGRRVNFVAHYGAETNTGPADRVPGTTTPTPTPRKAEIVMDLHVDKKRTRSVSPVDEFGNATTFDGTFAYTVDDPALVNLTDNGDGSCVIAAVGGSALGVANLTFTAAPTVGDPIVRVEAVNVIAGEAESFTFVDGAEEEVTPDVPTA